MSNQMQQHEPFTRRRPSTRSEWAETGSCVYTTEFLPFPTGEILVVWVAGEVDLATLPVLQQALRNSLDHHPVHLVIDLGHLQ